MLSGMPEKIKPLNLINVVSTLLTEGVDVQIIRKAFTSGGLSQDDVDYIISYVFNVESDRGVNLAYQYLDEIKQKISDILKVLKESG